jgi:ribose 5-phosphate isomerase B
MAKSIKQTKSPADPTVIIGSDHAGFKTKQRIIKTLANKGYTIVDVGTFSEEHVDYPQYAAEVAKAVAGDKSVRGILICGTGTGMVIAANKIKGIRAAFAFDDFGAKMAREHNDANVLALRGREFPATKAAKLAELFLKTEFSDDARHKRRIAQLTKLEGK